MADFPHSLRLLRNKRRLGIKTLARQLGVPYTYISHIERGKAKPSEELIRKLATYLQVDAEEMLLSTGRFPPDIEKILYEHPKEVVILLRESFATYAKPKQN